MILRIKYNNRCENFHGGLFAFGDGFALLQISNRVIIGVLSDC